MGNIIWTLDRNTKTGFYMKERVRGNRFSLKAAAHAWFPSLQECLEDHYGTIADVSIAEKSSDYTIIKLSKRLKKRWKFSKYDGNRSIDRRRPKITGPVLDKQGIRIHHGIRRSALSTKIDPNVMFTEVSVTDNHTIKIKCSENRTHSPNRDNPNDTVFKFDLFLESKKTQRIIRNIWIDPVIRNDGGDF